MEKRHVRIALIVRARRLARGVLALAVAALALGAQGEWEFRMLSTPEGVWVNEIESLVEDERGAVWAATWGEGLHQIDRTSWDTFRESSGFIGDWQRSLVVDPSGAVWVGTADGICRFKNGDQLFITLENSPDLASHGVTTMLLSHDGRLLFGTEQGFIYRTAGVAADGEQPPQWELLADPEVTGGASVADLEQTADRRLWASLKLDGLLVLSDGRWERVEGIPLGRSNQLTVDGPEGELWAAHEFGRAEIFRVAPGTPAPIMSAGTGINCFALDAGGILHAGTDEGLFRLQEGEWQPVALGATIGAPNVRSVLFASDGSLWVGCQEGLLRGTQKTFAEVATPIRGLGFYGLTADASSGSGIAITTRNSLQLIRDGQLAEEVPLQGARAGGPKSWAVEADGPLWILFEDGTAIEYDWATGAALREVPKPAAYETLTEPYMDLFVRSNRQLLFHGDGGVHQLTDGTWTVLDRDDGTSAWEHISTVAEGPDGTLYFGGYESVTIWRDGSVEHFETRYGVELGDSSHTLLVDQENRLWIGTHGSGIYTAGIDGVQQFTREDGLRSDSVSRLYQAADGAIWAAYRRRGVGRLLNGHWQNFDLDQGLPNAAITQVVAITPNESWFLAASGVPYRFMPDREPPDTWIVAAPDRIDSHGIASFSFGGWDAWNHTPSGQLRYATRVVPIESADASTPWSSYGPSSTFVTPSLGQGAYRFEVRAVDENGNADPVPASVSFSVLPPLWQKPGFWIPLLCAAALGLFFLLSWLRDFYRLRESQTALEGVNQILLAEIEQRDAIEHALRESEAHLEEAQGVARIGSWSLDLRTGKSVWSKELFSIYDVDPAGGVPDLEGFMELVHPDDRRDMRRLVPRLLESREPQELVFRGNPDRGLCRYYQCHARVVESKDGHVHSLSGTSQDITDQRNAELARIELEEKLRHAQKLEAVGRLAGGIAHDFNNILHALLGYCQIARDRGMDDSTLLAECLEGIEMGGNRASDLVRQLLAFSRRDQVRPTTQHLEPIVDEALLLLRRTLPATIEIRRDLAALRHPVHADATQVHQVVLNLCTNAAHAMEDKGGILRVEVSNIEFTEPPLLPTGELSAGDYVCLSVHDTGPGIPPDVLERVFDPFFTTKETGRGTGLGLATVHGIVTSLGGGIDIESSLGRGTTFRVYFRRSTAPVVKEPEATETEVGTGSGRILLVDDEPNIARLSKLALQNHGFEVDVYTDPLEALATFTSRADGFALVVTDLTMPRLTGLDLAERIHEVAPDLPVLLVSGRLDNDVEASPFISEVLHKPLPMARLVEAVVRHLDTRDAVL